MSEESTEILVLKQQIRDLQARADIQDLRLIKCLNNIALTEKALKEKISKVAFDLAMFDESFLQSAEEKLLSRLRLQAQISGTEILTRYESLINKSIIDNCPEVMTIFKSMEEELREMKLEHENLIKHGRKQVEDIVKRLKGRAEIAIDKIEAKLK